MADLQRFFTTVATLFIVVLSVPAFAEEAVGERFRKVIADTDAWCKREKRGPYLDKGDPEYRKKVADTTCDILKLKPRDWRETKFVKLESQPYPIPEDWLATPEGRFAHSIKLPSPHDKPKDVYKPGMSGGEYFQALCRAEAGDFLFRSVGDTEGVVRLRLPEVGIDELLRHLFATESTPTVSIGHLQTRRDDLGDTLVQPPHGKYRFAETPSFPTTSREGQLPYRRFVRDADRAPQGAISSRDEKGNWITVKRVVAVEEAIALLARYGYTWRGIVRPNDRELGIAGGELIAIDTETKQVLGVRRIFRLTGLSQHGTWWLSATNCSRDLAGGVGDFLYRVLKPAAN